MSPLEKFSRWVQLKIYQLEVTFSVYIFTPVEKFFFWSVVFLLFSLTFIATTLYLPQHIVFLIDRAWFYVHGDGADALDLASGAALAASSSSSIGLASGASLVREL